MNAIIINPTAEYFVFDVDKTDMFKEHWHTDTGFCTLNSDSSEEPWCYSGSAVWRMDTVKHFIKVD
jgi:hypothetical protein